jgi:3-deoxy-D-manno-octulosonic-acid transferase
MNALDLLYAPAAIALAPGWALKRRAGWGERFGRVSPLPAPVRRPRVLLHAVSVGEAAALRAVVPALTPDADVVVSATTDTGLARARELYAPAAHVVRYPLDFSGSVARFLDAVRPDAVALAELEVWPNFVRACKGRAIPVGIISGRLSERSLRGYQRIRGYFGGVLRDLDFIAVQDEDYAARFAALGVPRERVQVVGSMKWDAAAIAEGPVPGALELAATLGLDPARATIVAGSTGPGEEALLHGACPPGVQLVCAPRRPERFDEAARDLPGCVRLSRLRTGDQAPRGTLRFLIDTIGDLRKAYSLAHVVVVGRSFMGDLFGSDPIEPAALGKPVVIGPHTSDFAQVVRTLEAGGGLLRSSTSRLAADLLSLVEAPTRRADLSRSAVSVVRAQQGASVEYGRMVLEAGRRRVGV